MATALAITPSNHDSARRNSERLGAKISELCSYIYAAEHRLLMLIREFDEHEGWAHLGFHSCAHWLNFKCGIDMNTARLIMSKSSSDCTGALSGSRTLSMQRRSTTIVS